VKRFVGPGSLLAMAAAGCVVLTSGSVPGVAVGLAGAVGGILVGLAALQLGMLAGALAFGARVHRVVVGMGRRWREWVTPQRTIALRRIPVLLSVGVGPGRRPVRTRLWAAGLCSALAGIAVPAMLWWASIPGGPGWWPAGGDPGWWPAGGDSGWWPAGGGVWWSAGGAWSALGRGVAIGAAAMVAHSLLPRQNAMTTSTGWLLFGLPRMTDAQVADLRAGSLADEALAAVQAGDLAAADRAAATLAERFPDARATGATRAAVLEAHGRYAEALSVVMAMAGDPTQTPRDAALMMAGVAGLATTAVEAGQVPADAALPIARQAVDDAVQLGYPSFKLNGTRALLALLDGDPDTAATLARGAADINDHALSRADDLATLARANMAAGDNRAARAALAEAEALAAWWPRVTTTRRRLDL
jgi:hypothetical protein